MQFFSHRFQKLPQLEWAVPYLLIWWSSNIIYIPPHVSEVSWNLFGNISELYSGLYRLLSPLSAVFEVSPLQCYVIHVEAWCFWDLCFEQGKSSTLAPSGVRNSVSPRPTLWITGHGGRILGQTWAGLSDGIETSFSHRSALPYSSAPFLLGTLKAASTPTVKPVNLGHIKHARLTTLFTLQSLSHTKICQSTAYMTDSIL